MFLHGHMQNAYVTHDLDRAMELVGKRFGVEKFDRFDRLFRVDSDLVEIHPVGSFAGLEHGHHLNGLALILAFRIFLDNSPKISGRIFL